MAPDETSVQQAAAQIQQIWTTNTTATTPPVLPVMSDITGSLDPQAAGAVEFHEATVHLDPFDAAKELRTLAKEGWYMVEEPNAGQLQKGPGYDTETTGHLNRIREQLDDQFAYLDRQKVHLAVLEPKLDRLALLITQRKVAPTKELLEEIRVSIRTVSGMRDKADTVRVKAWTEAGFGRQRQKTLRLYPPAVVASEHPQRFRDILNRIHTIAQAIPTQPNMPLPDRASNALRAIAAILKVNGFVTASVAPKAIQEAQKVQEYVEANMSGPVDAQDDFEPNDYDEDEEGENDD